MAWQMEEAESRGSQLSRSKTLLQSQVEELKKTLDEEVKVSACLCLCVCMCVKAEMWKNQISRYMTTMMHPPCIDLLYSQCKQSLNNSLSSVQQECEVLKEQLEEEQESKQELQRLVSKLNSEVTHWRSKHEADIIQHADELEDTKCVQWALMFLATNISYP